MTAQDPGVYISPAQTYQEVRDLGKAVGRIESKLDALLDDNRDIRGDLADHEARLRAIEAAPKTSDIEPRVTTLEKARWPLPSLAALVGRRRRHHRRHRAPPLTTTPPLAHAA